MNFFSSADKPNEAEDVYRYYINFITILFLMKEERRFQKNPISVVRS